MIPCQPREVEPVLLINWHSPPKRNNEPIILNAKIAHPLKKSIANTKRVRTACTGNKAILKINLNTVIIGSPFPSPTLLYKQLIGAHIPEPGYYQAPSPVTFYMEFQGILQTPSYSYLSDF